jgi:hypothetical protein
MNWVRALTYIVILFVIYAAVCWPRRPRGLILTSTTYFDFAKEDHYETFCKGIDSILQQNDPAQIDHWLVVNEWSATPKADWVNRMRKRYPFIEFIQKTKDQKGQARSLNMILERVRPYEYWIHWEESWYSTKPFLDRALRVMQTTNIDQLQLTTTAGEVDWADISTNICNQDYCVVRQPLSPILLKSPYDVGKQGMVEFWPPYSLRPSINRVAIYRRIGTFSEDPALWPYRFEWDYAVRWLCAGGVKGILPDGPVTRSKKHVSTYA